MAGLNIEKKKELEGLSIPELIIKLSKVEKSVIKDIVRHEFKHKSTQVNKSKEELDAKAPDKKV